MKYRLNLIGTALLVAAAITGMIFAQHDREARMSWAELELSNWTSFWLMVIAGVACFLISFVMGGDKK
ncbi:MAG: hypothetical protein IPL41_01460 [Micropruina sp.]|nr:hypothetical protein [Micropruina sp.]